MEVFSYKKLEAPAFTYNISDKHKISPSNIA